MLIFIAILPAQFSVDQTVNLQGINANVREIQTIVATTDTTEFGKDELKQYHQIQDHAVHFGTLVKTASFSTDIEMGQRFNLRKDIVKITKGADKLLKSPNFAISTKDKKILTRQIKESKKSILNITVDSDDFRL